MTTIETKAVIRADAADFERVVYAEVLVPNTLNVYNDFSTPEMVKNCAYEFARQGYGLDVEHDRVDVTGTGFYVVESFIARADDPDFIPGSWVVGIKVVDDAIWQQIVDNELNGFSFDADMFYEDGEFPDPGNRVRIGVTEPDLFDGHTHTYTVVIGSDNRVISGGTNIVDGHTHPVTAHTVTGTANGHTHRYQIVEGEDV